MENLFRPLGDNLLINPISLEKTTSAGVSYLYNEQHKVQRGVVVSIGLGIKKLGKDIHNGDMVLFPVNGGLAVKLNDHNFIIISQQKLIAII